MTNPPTHTLTTHRCTITEFIDFYDDVGVYRPRFNPAFWDGAYGWREMITVGRIFEDCRGG